MKKSWCIRTGAALQNSKCGEKLKYQNWCPLKIFKISDLATPQRIPLIEGEFLHHGFQRHSRLSTALEQLTQHLLTVRAKAVIFSHWSRAKGKGKNHEKKFLIGPNHFLFSQGKSLIPNPIDVRGWVTCTQFQPNSLISSQYHLHFSLLGVSYT